MLPVNINPNQPQQDAAAAAAGAGAAGGAEGGGDQNLNIVGVQAGDFRPATLQSSLGRWRLDSIDGQQTTLGLVNEISLPHRPDPDPTRNLMMQFEDGERHQYFGHLNETTGDFTAAAPNLNHIWVQRTDEQTDDLDTVVRALRRCRLTTDGAELHAESLGLMEDEEDIETRLIDLRADQAERRMQAELSGQVFNEAEITIENMGPPQELLAAGTKIVFKKITEPKFDINILTKHEWQLTDYDPGDGSEILDGEKFPMSFKAIKESENQLSLTGKVDGQRFTAKCEYKNDGLHLTEFVPSAAAPESHMQILKDFLALANILELSDNKFRIKHQNSVMCFGPKSKSGMISKHLSKLKF